MGRSSARYEADAQGRVDVPTAAAQGPSYRGADGTGLLWSMLPDDPGQGFFVPPFEGADVRLEATAGDRPAASGRVRRVVFEEDGDVIPFLPRGRGINGELHRPSRATGVSVLVVGGAEGGLSTSDLAARLAARGHTALALAYFEAEGVPTGLWRIRLEYFLRAIRILREEGRPVVILGISRGTEAAMLTAARFPGRVAGIVAVAPTNATGPGDNGRPAWTAGGRPVPHMTVAQFGNPTLTPRRAVIPVERAGVPVLTVAGSEDAVWPSDVYARKIARRLRERSRVSGHRHIVLRGAGHGIGGVLPNHPGWQDWMGGSAEADARGKQRLWRELLAFLHELR